MFVSLLWLRLKIPITEKRTDVQDATAIGSFISRSTDPAPEGGWRGESEQENEAIIQEWAPSHFRFSRQGSCAQLKTSGQPVRDHTPRNMLSHVVRGCGRRHEAIDGCGTVRILRYCACGVGRSQPSCRLPTPTIPLVSVPSRSIQ